MENKKPDRPGVGTGIWLINKDNKVLISYRKKNKLYGFPGGHLERYNTFEECASQEMKEETDLDIPPEKMHFVGAMNVPNKDAKYHYIELAIACKFDETQKVVNTEPHNHGDWEWWSFEDLHKRKNELFYPTQLMLDEYREVFNIDNLRKIIGN